MNATCSIKTRVCKVALLAAALFLANPQKPRVTAQPANNLSGAALGVAVTPWGFAVGRPSMVMVKAASLNPALRLRGAFLSRIDPFRNLAYPLGPLSDDGNRGDERALDGVFSAEVFLPGNEPGMHFLVVTGDLADSAGQSLPAVSSLRKVEVLPISRSRLTTCQAVNFSSRLFFLPEPASPLPYLPFVNFGGFRAHFGPPPQDACEDEQSETLMARTLRLRENPTVKKITDALSAINQDGKIDPADRPHFLMIYQALGDLTTEEGLALLNTELRLSVTLLAELGETLIPIARKVVCQFVRALSETPPAGAPTLPAPPVPWDPPKIRSITSRELQSGIGELTVDLNGPVPFEVTFGLHGFGMDLEFWDRMNRIVIDHNSGTILVTSGTVRLDFDGISLPDLILHSIHLPMKLPDGMYTPFAIRGWLDVGFLIPSKGQFVSIGPTNAITPLPNPQ